MAVPLSLPRGERSACRESCSTEFVGSPRNHFQLISESVLATARSVLLGLEIVSRS